MLCAFPDRVQRFHLLYLQDNVAWEWKQFARQLKDLRDSDYPTRSAFTECRLRQFERECGDDVLECFYKILREWVEMSKEKHTVRRLIGALLGIKEVKKAEALAKLKKAEVDYHAVRDVSLTKKKKKKKKNKKTLLVREIKT